VAALGAFGTSLGLAFQITDDVLDFVGDEEDFGKTVGRDLAAGMATLPMIFAAEERPDLGPRIVAQGKGGAEIRELLRAVRATEGIERARRRALALHDDATRALHRLPEGPERAALGGIVNFVVSRVR
jgi:geranylgeranyl pyrophosphate synthase